MTCGTVAWFDPQRGVGAIALDGTGTEISVDSAQIDGGGRQSLQKDSRVAFDLQHGPRGLRAVGVYVP